MGSYTEQAESGLASILNDLRNRTDEEDKYAAANSLRSYVLTKSRELSKDAYDRWLKTLLKTYIGNMINSQLNTERLGALMAVERLIDVAYDNYTSILSNYYRMGLRSNDQAVMTWAAKAIGSMSCIGSTITAECVAFDMRGALEWLQVAERQETKRHAACLILRELALKSPTLFYGYVSSFVDLVWVALRDPKPAIRECAVEALEAALELISERENRFRLQWYQKIYEEVSKGFNKFSTTESVHASLLVVGAMLKHTGSDFLKDRYQDIAQTVFKHRDNRDKLIKKTVVLVIPRLASFSPEEFIKNYLDLSINHLVASSKKDTDAKKVSFIAIGDISVVVKDSIRPHLDAIMSSVRIALQPKVKGIHCASEAVTCIAKLSTAVGSAMRDSINELMEPIFASGLSQSLTDSLSTIASNIPEISTEIQENLLDLLSITLAGKLFYYPGTPAKWRRKIVNNPPPIPAVPLSKEEQDRVIALALRILGNFNFDPHLLTELLRTCIVNYLKDPNPQIRKESALCCCKLMASSSVKTTEGRYYAIVVSEILERLISVGIADPDTDIRLTVLKSLDFAFDAHLAQANNLRSLFIALNDEVFEIRQIALNILCRLAQCNPAHVLPSLRKTLIRLLTQLEHSGDSRTKEESSKLLGILIEHSPLLVKPYVDPLMKALMPKLREGDAAVSSSALSTVGTLASVTSEYLKSHLNELLPLIIETLQDQSSPSKREVAIKTLGQLAEHTGYVIKPFTDWPKLLDTILTEVQTETNPSIRLEVIKVFGIIGALDPYKQRMNQLALEGRMDDDDDALGTGKTQKTPDKDGISEALGNLSPSSEDYYPTITIASLMRILKDPSLSQYRTLVIHALMFIIKSLGIKSIQFLPQIMPPFIQVMRSCDPDFRIVLFQLLGQIVARVRQHIRDYLPEIFSLIQEYWQSPNLVNIITLIEEISGALNDEFKLHIPNLLPQILSVLHNEHENHEAVSRALHALVSFGNNLEEYVHLVIPATVKICDNDSNKRLRLNALSTLIKLCSNFNVSNQASRILNPLARVLDSNSTDLQQAAMTAILVVAKQLGRDYQMFTPNIDKIIAKHHIVHGGYESFVSNLNNVAEGRSDAELLPRENPVHRSDSEMNIEDTPQDTVRKIKLNEHNLRRAWEVSQRSTREDWVEWLRQFSVALLRESPSPALRSCISVANDYHPLVKELFNAGFVSCWSELPEQYQNELIMSLETALSSPNIPPEILQILLNLAEFMEQDEKPLPIDPKTLGSLAEKCHAFAKALHYKEMEFRTSPVTAIEALIAIYNQLQLPEAALGILTFAQKNYNVELKESWYEKLERWEQALEAYQKKPSNDPENSLGKMRCLHALGEWDRLATLSAEIWKDSSQSVKKKAAPCASSCAWNMGNWDLMAKYVDGIEHNSVESGFFHSVLAIHNEEFEKAAAFIEATRRQVDTDLSALMGESYSRAYEVIVKVQQLAELEEVISYKKYPERRNIILHNWKERLAGCDRHIDTWQNILSVRSLVLSPLENVDSWIKFSALCRRNGRIDLSYKTIMNLLGVSANNGRINPFQITNANPRVLFGYIKHMWDAGQQRAAFDQLRRFAPVRNDGATQARIFRKLGEWHSALEGFDEGSIPSIIHSFHGAIEYDANWHKAWHAWALANYEAISYYEKQPPTSSRRKITAHLIPAVSGFFKSIALGPAQSLQDLLRLLNLWFKYGQLREVETALTEGFTTVSIDTWLQVIPQIIARIHSPIIPVRRLINDLLTQIGKVHPQALVYPLQVASKSNSSARVSGALAVIEKIKKHSATLVEQAQLVSNELVRTSILWHEMWHEGIEEASRTCFAEKNTDAMLATLKPLHEMLERGPETLREISFQQAYGRDLQDAYERVKRFERNRRPNELNLAWDLYYKVFRRLNKQLPQLTTLELSQESPKLLNARDLEASVPGTYRTNGPVVRIKSFNPSLSVILSKQRPRKLIINGSDGAEYQFLLKGHEDLRQDERVMQLFGLVNTLLAHEYETSKNHLNIQRYSVIPLSPNSGLIGWVPHCDTLHQLIRDYRDSRKIWTNIEHRLMMQMAPDLQYDNLTLMQKVEAFEYALDSTNGSDLERILWLKSSNSEMWLDRRTNYTRSLGVMSMVGYILGLGDRHPSNLMLDRHTGRVLHIDFGECFEVATHRDKYPEKIPFRLTRMLIKAMEVSGIEGTFRSTCESVMKVMRKIRRV
eukprot:TRINITY_DN5444_c0_g1_i3.p1 TRINITY_DN5444_c0_g1~~TRINITY_DN5444_c0_g1_i3.p1  ORF type:complete len:2209 (+),score=787.54 TRINITY_DN5444_c0_g1_i3:161-6787(+)